MAIKKVEIKEFIQKMADVKKWEDNNYNKTGKRRLPNYVIFHDGSEALIADWLDAVKRYTSWMAQNKIVPNYVNIKIRDKPAPAPVFSLIAPVKCYYTDTPPMWHYGHPWYNNLVHVGKDVCRNTNADVVAVADGTVRQSYNSTKWAGVIVIEHPIMVDGKTKYFTTNSWHINRTKNVGSKVKKGEKIGTIYRGLRKLSGESNVNDHLHFGVRIGAFDSTYSQKGALPSTNLRGFVDPDKFLKNPLNYLK